MSVQLKKNKLPVTRAVEYPEGDGKPMAESDLHREIMFYIIHLLQRFFAGQPVYISGNLLIYFEKGNPYKSVAPDCFVVRDIDPRRRPIYKIWDEGKSPEVVFEVSSKSTKRADLNEKMRLYAQLGIQEYFIYDPTRDYLDPPLAGFVLTDTGYTPMQPLTGLSKTTEKPEYISQRLGLRLTLDDDNRLQFFHITTGERLLTDDEARQQAEAAHQQAEVERQQADMARQQADIARQQAEQVAHLALTRATDLDAENARLRAELARLRGESPSA